MVEVELAPRRAPEGVCRRALLLSRKECGVGPGAGRSLFCAPAKGVDTSDDAAMGGRFLTLQGSMMEPSQSVR